MLSNALSNATLAARASSGRRLPATRSVAAVLAGLVTTVVTSTATDLALLAAGVLPSFDVYWDGPSLALALAYRIGYGVLGCYLAARIGRERPLAHALVLGAVGFVLSVAGAIVMWDAGEPWYSLALIAQAMPAAWLGGHLASRRATARTRAA